MPIATMPIAATSGLLRQRSEPLEPAPLRPTQLHSSTMSRPRPHAAAIEYLRRTLLWVVAALSLLAAGSARPASASDLHVALARLASNDLAETQRAIAEIAASGSPRAGALLAALGDRRLRIDGTGRVIMVDANGAATLAASGAVLEGLPAEARVVRINNRLRGLIAAAAGSLALRAADPATRRAAVAAVFRARDPEVLPVLRAALASERDPAIAVLMAEAEAAIVLTRPAIATEQRLAAVATLAARGGAEAIAALRPALAGSDAAVAEAARAAVQRIEQHQRVIAGVQTVWHGLSLGSVLLLAAIGLAITFGVMGVINMAHGEMVMLGAYTTFLVQEGFRAWAPGAFDASILVALPAAFLVAGGVGVAIERGIIRFLYGRPLETLLATWGVSLVLQQAVRTLFGPTNREVGAPSWMAGSIEVAGLQLTLGRLWIIAFALMVFTGLLVLLKATPLGLQMRAVTQSRRMAASMGIRTGRVDALTFGLGSGIAGLAGVALSQIDNVSPNLGQSYIIDSFMVVVFGGVGNLWGTLVSAMALGITNKVLEPMAGAVLAKILILVLIILFIQKRPRGLFALRGRAVES